MRKIFSLVALALALSSFLVFQNKDNELTQKEKKEGWVLLFDGKSLNGWRTYQNKPSDTWMVEDGQIACRKEGVKQHADLLTVDQYENFELQLDWKIAKGQNSGIIYRCNENNGASYESGPEYQLIDDLGYPDKLTDKQLSGANYDMDAPRVKVAKPAGEYNHTRILVRGTHVEHWLNGSLLVSYEFGTPEWKWKKDNSKWKDAKEYGTVKNGYIAIQDHGGGLWVKNVKIKALR